MNELDEMCVPGGLTWDEPTAMPMLADFECGHCGAIGRHDVGCPYDYESEAPMVECKIDGCENEAVQQFGKFGRLCAEHRPTSGNGHVAVELPVSVGLLLDEGPTSMGEVEAEGREQYERYEAESEPCGVCGATRDRDRCNEFKETGACLSDLLVPVAVPEVVEESKLVEAARRVDRLRVELEAAREELFRLV